VATRAGAGIAAAAAVGVETPAGALLPQAAISKQADAAQDRRMKWRLRIRGF
jgi:hypothetical protein